MIADLLFPDELDILNSLIKWLFIIHRVHDQNGVHVWQVVNWLKKNKSEVWIISASLTQVRSFFFMKQTLFSHFTDSSIKNIIFWGYLFCTSCNVLRLDREEEWVVWHFTSDMFSNWTISFRSFYTTMSLCDCHFPFKSNLLLLLLRSSNLNQRTSWRLKGQRIGHQI